MAQLGVKTILRPLWSQSDGTVKPEVGPPRASNEASLSSFVHQILKTVQFNVEVQH